MRPLLIVLLLLSALTVWGLTPLAVELTEDILPEKLTQKLKQNSALQHEVEMEKNIDKHDETTIGTEDRVKGTKRAAVERQRPTDEVKLPDVSSKMNSPTNYSHIDLAMETKTADEEKQQQSSATDHLYLIFNDEFITTDSHTTTQIYDGLFNKAPTKYSLRAKFFEDRPHNVNNKETVFQCPLPFGFFIDPYGNCTVYYVCHDGLPEKRVCPLGMHFNPVSKLCDYQEQAVCEQKCPVMNGRFHIPGYCNWFLECYLGQGKRVKCPADLHYNAVTKQCDAKSKAACEISCSSRHHLLVSLPGRCEMYASCEEGNATYHLCPHGLHFNPVLLKCDWPQNAGCEIKCPFPDGYFPILRQCNSYILCRNNHPKVETCPSHLHFNFLLQTCDIPSKAGCSMECERPNGFFPFPGVCSFFLMCVGGTPFLKKCPGELEFNEATGQCAAMPKDHCLPHCPEESGTFPIDDRCDLYIRCANGQPLVKRCPGNLHFNAVFKQCDTPERSKCEVMCPHASGVFPIPGKCNKFYQCINNTASLRTCPEGLHFNSRTASCDWPVSAHCEPSCPNLDGYAPVQGDCTAYVSCSAGRPTLRKCPSGKHFNFRAKRCDAPEEAHCLPKCEEDDEVFPLPGHCDSYYKCEQGVPHLGSCPPGLFFDQHTGMCDLSDRARCHLWHN